MPEQLIPSDAVKAIQDSTRIETIQVDGELYTTRPVHLPPREPRLDPITIHTLTGLVDFINAEGLADLIVHVVSATEVEIVSAPEGRYRVRETYAIANCEPIIGKGFRFGEYQSVEQFVVNLQAQFEPTEARAAVLRVIGNLRQEQVKTLSDDGVTQKVVTSAGISRVENAEVPNPVSLKPFRTFPEIGQPESNFVLRLQQAARDGELPKCALFEADGGQWKLEAIRAIRDYLKAEIADLTIVA
jgi:hypothetical protein